MSAPQAAVQAKVSDFHAWPEWSPWEKLDPNMKRTFEGPPSGVGAGYAWVGNDDVGEGKMTLTESRPYELIETRVEMVKPMKGSSTSEFTFKPEGDQTTVTWSVAAHHNFMEKALCLIFGGKRMMSDLMDKGLAQMKSVVLPLLLTSLTSVITFSALRKFSTLTWPVPVCPSFVTP